MNCLIFSIYRLVFLLVCIPVGSFAANSMHVEEAGVYKSDDIQWILQYPLKNFGPRDAVIFDVDDVLITQPLDPFRSEHFMTKSPLWNRFSLLGVGTRTPRKGVTNPGQGM